MKENKNEPQVNPPKMASHDLSDAEMEVRQIMNERERSETTNTSQDSSQQENDPFRMNQNQEQD